MCGGNSASTDRKQELNSYGQLNNLYNTFSSYGSSLQSQGAQDTGQASKYYSAILSGNPAAVAAATAPVTNAANQQAQQQKQEIQRTGNRVGGTNAASQGITSNTRGQVADTISKAQGSAAAGEAGIGSGETGAALAAYTGAGTAASNLGSIANANRSQSQQIHDSAVQQWADVAATLLLS